MKKYIIMLSVGLLFSFSLCFTIIEGCPYWVNLLMDIFTMLGSGLVCSTVVSWCVELNNMKREKQLINRQRIFALSAVVSRTKYLIKNEIKNMSGFLIMREERKRKVRKAKASIEECVNNLHNMLIRINSIMKAEYKPSPLKERMLFADMVPAYQALNRNVLNVLSDSSVYFVNGVLDEESVEKLQEFQERLNEIISLSYASSVEEVIEEKLAFIEEILTILPAIYIDISQPMEYLINEEIGAAEIAAE